MYVYDAFFRTDTIEESISLAKQFCDFLMEDGFPLRKWAANHTDLAHLPTDWLVEEPVNNSILLQNHTLLGLVWKLQDDKFSFRTDFLQISHPVTKRKVLSLLSRLYGTLGLLSPLTTRSKFFFQNFLVTSSYRQFWRSCQFRKKIQLG